MHTINRTTYANLILTVVAMPVLVGFLTTGAVNAQGKTKIRIATASPSLSYLPIYIAVKKGFFAKRGFDVEMIQMNASLTAPGFAQPLSRLHDYSQYDRYRGRSWRARQSDFFRVGEAPAHAPRPSRISPRSTTWPARRLPPAALAI